MDGEAGGWGVSEEVATNALFIYYIPTLQLLSYYTLVLTDSLHVYFYH